jgi:hypothetical protein
MGNFRKNGTATDRYSLFYDHLKMEIKLEGTRLQKDNLYNHDLSHEMAPVCDNIGKTFVRSFYITTVVGRLNEDLAFFTGKDAILNRFLTSLSKRIVRP